MTAGPKSRVPLGIEGLLIISYCSVSTLVLATVLNESNYRKNGHREKNVLHEEGSFTGAKFGNPWEPTKPSDNFPVIKALFTM